MEPMKPSAAAVVRIYADGRREVLSGEPPEVFSAEALDAVLRLACGQLERRGLLGSDVELPRQAAA